MNEPKTLSPEARRVWEIAARYFVRITGRHPGSLCGERIDLWENWFAKYGWIVLWAAICWTRRYTKKILESGLSLSDFMGQSGLDEVLDEAEWHYRKYLSEEDQAKTNGASQLELYGLWLVYTERVAWGRSVPAVAEAVNSLLVSRAEKNEPLDVEEISDALAGMGAGTTGTEPQPPSEPVLTQADAEFLKSCGVHDWERSYPAHGQHSHQDESALRPGTLPARGTLGTGAASSQICASQKGGKAMTEKKEGWLDLKRDRQALAKGLSRVFASLVIVGCMHYFFSGRHDLKRDLQDLGVLDKPVPQIVEVDKDMYFVCDDSLRVSESSVEFTDTLGVKHTVRGGANVHVYTMPPETSAKLCKEPGK